MTLHGGKRTKISSGHCVYIYEYSYECMYIHNKYICSKTAVQYCTYILYLESDAVYECNIDKILFYRR